MINVQEIHLKEMLLSVRSHLEAISDADQDKDSDGTLYNDVQRLKDAYTELRDYWPGMLKEDDPLEEIQ